MSRILELDKKALDDLNWWAKNEPKRISKIFNLIEAILKDPFAGIGKPEGLKGNLSGVWSRRITDEHRIT